MGRPPFDGSTFAVLHGHCFRNHDAPSGLAGLHLAVDTVFTRALSKDPRERLPTVSRFAQALTDAFDPASVDTTAPPARSNVTHRPYLVLVNPWLDPVDASISDFAAAVEQWRYHAPLDDERLLKMPASVTVGDDQLSPLDVALPDTGDLWTDQNFDAVVRAAGVRRGWVRRIARLVWLPSGGSGAGH